MKFSKKVFSSGLTLVTVPMAENPTATVMVMTSTGSQHETKNTNGISHFLEHMLFKGTEKRPSSKIITEELEDLGSQYNAFTGAHYTGYYAKGKVADWETLLEIISDMYLNPTIPAEELEKERGVILEEINMRQDDPQYVAADTFDTLMFGDQPAGWNVLGPKKNIRILSRNSLRNYHKKHYVAGKTIVVIAGGVQVNKVAKVVGEMFKYIPKAKQLSHKPAKGKQVKPRKKIVARKVDQAHLMLGFSSMPFYDADYPAAKVLAAVLGGGMSSRLFMRVREELGAAYYVSAGQYPSPDVGTFAVRAGADAKRVKLVVQVIREEISRLKEEPVPKDELQRVKNLLTGNIILGLESSDAYTNYYAMQYAMGAEVSQPKKYIKAIEKVTSKQLLEVARKIFDTNKENLVVVGPKGIKV